MGTLVIRNGKVYNLARYEWSYKDIAVEDGRIVEGLPPGDCEMVDASGCIVTAELVDYHIHYFNHGTENGVNPDTASFSCGITIVVDGGSCDAANYEMCRRGVMSFSDVRILSMLLMGSEDQATSQYPERIEERYSNHDRIRALFKIYPGDLVGLKLKLSAGVIGEDEAEKSLRATVAVAEELNCNTCVYITDPAMDLEKLAGMLCRNNVICHVYQGKDGETILDENEMVRKGIMDARGRGVLSNTSNGYNNYDLEISRKAVKQEFIPDIIGSDINTAGFYFQPLHNLPRIMSKCLDMGVCLERVLDAVTTYPARLVGREELVSLDMSGTADVAILRLVEKEVCYRDRKRRTFTGHQVIVPQITIKDSKMVYCQADLA